MNPPRAVVFDLGKVLLAFDYAIAVRQIAPHTRGGADAVAQAVRETDLLRRYETGLIDTESFFAEVSRITGFTSGFEVFRDCFSDIFAEIPAMVALHEALRQAAVPTYLLSNTNDLQSRHIRQRFPFFSRFDGYALSFEHQSMKPEPRLYEVVETLSGLKGEDLFFLDDRPENVEAAWRRGWRGVVHTAPEASWAAVRAAGLNIRGTDSCS